MDSNEFIANKAIANEVIAKTVPEFLDSFIKKDEEALANYELEFKKNPWFGVRVLWACIHEIQDNKEQYTDPDDLLKRIRYFKRYFAIASKMNLSLIPEVTFSDKPEQFKIQQYALIHMLTGMRNIAHLMDSWAVHFETCNHEDNRLKEDAAIMRRRSSLLCKNLRVFVGKARKATTIAELNDICHEFIMVYVTKHPSNFSTVIKRK